MNNHNYKHEEVKVQYIKLLGEELDDALSLRGLVALRPHEARRLSPGVFWTRVGRCGPSVEDQITPLDPSFA